MVRQACPEYSRRAHHERLNSNTVRPELCRRGVPVFLNPLRNAV